MHKKLSGFTIVELLIVIVVIAILATISIVTYNGIQQRVNNAKTIASANQVVKAVLGYIAANSAYPSTGIYCVVPSENGACTVGNTTNRATDITLMNNLQTISTLPSSPVANAYSVYDGITYVYQASRKFNDNPEPLMILYTLKGAQQQCNMANIANNATLDSISSATGYSTYGSNYTMCVVSIPTP